VLANPLMYVFGELINIETKIFVTPKKDRAFHRSVQQILNFNLSKDHWSLKWCLIWIAIVMNWFAGFETAKKTVKIKETYFKVNFLFMEMLFWMLNQTDSVPFCQTSDYTNFPFYFYFCFRFFVQTERSNFVSTSVCFVNFFHLMKLSWDCQFRFALDSSIDIDHWHCINCDIRSVDQMNCFYFVFKLYATKKNLK
jgi:hypothetical protein